MSKAKPITVACPTCEKTVVWGAESEFRPFCSERCKLIDLGEWASEEKRIPGDELPLPTNQDDEF
ncbi:DNA gyrase inhibitor YacG [Aliidiomarina shirensis]|uniref:DNA gyrase inhibitor YacG n=1 Tax=Aliidiomarina shirensis TaxID=1048642 RepID=A0A432WUU7_9GAMM|nr:DNA gyrase inhibitor YacG [Aliidiomarina shirensis]RUO37534.1 DNA gyrase inhibitor YacG [Aliidiomarina shirensis]